MSSIPEWLLRRGENLSLYDLLRDAQFLRLRIDHENCEILGKLACDGGFFLGDFFKTVLKFIDIIYAIEIVKRPDSRLGRPLPIRLLVGGEICKKFDSYIAVHVLTPMAHLYVFPDEESEDDPEEELKALDGKAYNFNSLDDEKLIDRAREAVLAIAKLCVAKYYRRATMVAMGEWGIDHDGAPISLHVAEYPVNPEEMSLLAEKLKEYEPIYVKVEL